MEGVLPASGAMASTITPKASPPQRQQKPTGPRLRPPPLCSRRSKSSSSTQPPMPSGGLNFGGRYLARRSLKWLAVWVDQVPNMQSHPVCIGEIHPSTPIADFRATDAVQRIRDDDNGWHLARRSLKCSVSECAQVGRGPNLDPGQRLEPPDFSDGQIACVGAREVGAASDDVPTAMGQGQPGGVLVQARRGMADHCVQCRVSGAHPCGVSA